MKKLTTLCAFALCVSAPSFAAEHILSLSSNAVARNGGPEHCSRSRRKTQPIEHVFSVRPDIEQYLGIDRQLACELVWRGTVQPAGGADQAIQTDAEVLLASLGKPVGVEQHGRAGCEHRATLGIWPAAGDAQGEAEVGVEVSAPLRFDDQRRRVPRIGFAVQHRDRRQEQRRRFDADGRHADDRRHRSRSWRRRHAHSKRHLEAVRSFPDNVGNPSLRRL